MITTVEGRTITTAKNNNYSHDSSSQCVYERYMMIFYGWPEYNVSLAHEMFGEANGVAFRWALAEEFNRECEVED